MNILSIIPARGGSKGLPGKNIKLLCGKPLIAYTIEASSKCDKISRTIVSTDSPEIAEISRQYGAEIPFLRPYELSGDKTPSIDVVLHCMDFLKEKENYSPDYVCLLQCTSPLRDEKHITEAVELLLNKGANGVISVCEAEKSPYWAKTIDEKGNLKSLIPQENMPLRRQDAPVVYNINGAIYLNKTEYLYKNKMFVNDEVYPYVMNREASVDIDDEIDFILAEVIKSRYYKIDKK